MTIIPLIPLMKGKKALIGVEIGTDSGNSSIRISRYWDTKMLYTIDPYVWYGGYYESSIFKRWIEWGARDFYEQTKKRLEKYPNITFIRDFAHNVVGTFKDETLDFVFIDGNHSYEHTLQDIQDWYPKIKKGGIIMGDDIWIESVEKAVKEVFNEDVNYKGKRSWFVRK